MNFLNKIDRDISLLLDNLPVGIIRFNSDKQCVYMNKFIVNLFGLESNTLKTDMFFVYINSLHNDDKSMEMETNNKFLLNYTECETTVRLYNQQKREYRWTTNKRTFIRHENNPEDPNTFSYMYTLQDIHENKLLELKLLNETTKAERSYNSNSTFLTNISNQIRPSIHGSLEVLRLLEDTDLSHEQKGYINMIKEYSFSLMTTINDIVDYSKLEAGKITLENKQMNLRECIESTNEIVLSKIYEKSLQYNVIIDPKIPSVLNGDQNRIKQILLNLLDNSIKFTDATIGCNTTIRSNPTIGCNTTIGSNPTNGCNSSKGTITLNVKQLSDSEYFLLTSVYRSNLNSVSNIRTSKRDRFIRIDITDTGCGIHEDDICNLFKSNRSLSLAISKKLAELMNGCIWLDWSEVSKGSRFSFVFASK